MVPTVHRAHNLRPSVRRRRRLGQPRCTGPVGKLSSGYDQCPTASYWMTRPCDGPPQSACPRRCDSRLSAPRNEECGRDRRRLTPVEVGLTASAIAADASRSTSELACIALSECAGASMQAAGSFLPPLIGRREAPFLRSLARPAGASRSPPKSPANRISQSPVPETRANTRACLKIRSSFRNASRSAKLSHEHYGSCNAQDAPRR